MKKAFLISAFLFTALVSLAQALPSGTPSVIPDTGGLEPEMGILYQNPNYSKSKLRKIKVDTVHSHYYGEKVKMDSTTSTYGSRKGSKKEHH